MQLYFFATRRLWIRRSQAAWHLASAGVVHTCSAVKMLSHLAYSAAKMFSYVLPPVWAFWFYRWWFRRIKACDFDSTAFGLITQVVVAAVVGTVAWQNYLGRDATVEELRAARAADGCFDNTIVRRAAEWKRPVTMRDLRQTQDDCAEMWDKIARQKTQEKALAELGK